MDTDRGGVEAHRAQSLKIIKQWKVSVSSAAKAPQFHTHTESSAKLMQWLVVPEDIGPVQ